VEFYVPLGPRGLLFRFGTFLIGIIGGLVYEAARRRRDLVHTNPSLAAGLPEIIASD
jgi:hypothetical protein